MRGDAAGGTGSAYERALAEPRFLRSVRAAYVGPDDLLDALWWLDHPLRPGPSGARPPAADAAAARRALYGRSVPPQALDRYREAAEREEETRTAIAAALAAVEIDRPPLKQRLLEPPPAETDAGSMSRRVAPKGRWQDVFLQARHDPKVAPLVRLPRATIYAVETRPPTACLFLITDLGDFQAETAPVEVFEDRGVTLEVEPPLDGSIGLARVRWLPSGEVSWETRPVDRLPSQF
jgi:hypothetical protein